MTDLIKTNTILLSQGKLKNRTNQLVDPQNFEIITSYSFDNTKFTKLLNYSNQNELRESAKKYFLVNINHAYIETVTGLVFDESKIYHFNSAPPKKRRRKFKGTYEVKKINAPIVSLITSQSFLFQHFCFETLPQLALLETWFKDNPKVYYLLPKIPALMDIVKLYGILDSARIIWAEYGCIYESDNVLIGTWSNDGYRIVQGGCTNILKNFFLDDDGLPADSPLRNEVLYLTRADMACRRVTNEQDLLQMVTAELKDGYNLVVFNATGKVVDDKKKFSKARAIIGPHGGAFVNMIYMPEGTDVIEFNNYSFGPGIETRPCYWAAASFLGLGYSIVRPVKPIQEYHKGQMEVPVDNLGTRKKISIPILHSKI
ncbi:hypothetical protein MHK_009103 [Candidatus Magnetomorum sp. HK-1]|nr:hypothetical protein MHK_009103 [Candidatus Magnetomorum sp. HK-1]